LKQKKHATEQKQRVYNDNGECQRFSAWLVQITAAGERRKKREERREKREERREKKEERQHRPKTNKQKRPHDPNHHHHHHHHNTY
jgi:hypothetical protein